MVGISVNPHPFTGSQHPDYTRRQPPRPTATPWPRMLLTTMHSAQSGQFREVMIRSWRRNQYPDGYASVANHRATHGGFEACERFTPSPSSVDAYLAESFCCGWASGGCPFMGEKNTRTLLFPGWWSSPRACVRRG